MSHSSIINPTEINIYGINYFINRFSNDDFSKLEEGTEIINLDNLKDIFELDYNYNDYENEIEKSKLPAFTKLTYNAKSIVGGSKLISNYNRPPIGPLENYTYCSFCNNISPFYHDESCQNPEKKSLFLTIQGFFYYVIQTTTYDGPLIEIKNKWINNELTQEDLNKILLIPNSVKTKADTSKIKLDDTFTNIQYFDVVKVRGPSKLAYTTSTEKFSNTIILSYEINQESDDDDIKTSKTSIRISKNGLINLINLPASEDKQKELLDSLISRIDPDSINMDAFNTLSSEYTEKEFDKYEIIDDISYIHSINSQFNLWPVKNKYVLNFQNLTNIISPFNSEGKLIPGDYSEIIDKSGYQIINLKYGNNQNIKILNWEYSLGKETRIQTTTREEIKCTIIPIDGIKISLLIHKYGTFQMSMSYCNANDIRNNICTSVVNQNEIDLDKKYFENIRNIFSGIIRDNIDNLVSSNLSFTEQDSKEAKNTVSGNAPPKKPGTTTEVCRSKDPRPGFPSLRPIPYSFKGRCPESRQMIDPKGVLGSDGLYYPCCSAKTTLSNSEMKKYLINGFPRNETEGEEYGVNQYEDSKSGILVPGSTNIGAITKALINSEYVPVEIVGYPGKGKVPVKPKKFIVKNLQTGELITIDRELLQRDSRYFPGLKSFSKYQLIKCIENNLKKIDSPEIKTINNENLKQIKELINLTNYDELNYLNIEDFTSIKYYVGSIPKNCENFYLFINKQNQYLINNVGFKININLSQEYEMKLVLNGFYNKSNNNYYIIDILYFNDKPVNNDINFTDKIQILEELENLYFNFENNIELVDFKDNVIKSSADLLIESKDITLIYIPEKLSVSTYKLWNEVNKEDLDKTIVLQLIKRFKNYYSLGFNNVSLVKLPIDDVSFDNIFIAKKFIDDNFIKLNDYVKFEFDYNIQTGEISTRILNPIEKAKKPNMDYKQICNKILKILNPINEAFFLNNKYEQEFVWYLPDGNILKVGDSNLPLIEFSI